MSTAVAATEEPTQEIKGRSLTQIAWGRLRRDKTFIASAIVLIIIVLIAVFAPQICRLLGIDPYALDASAIDDSGGKPIGPWGGASLEHPLGVEWGTGLLLSIPAVGGVLLGTTLQQKVSERLISLVFAIVLVGVAIQMFFF